MVVHIYALKSSDSANTEKVKRACKVSEEPICQY